MQTFQEGEELGGPIIRDHTPPLSMPGSLFIRAQTADAVSTHPQGNCNSRGGSPPIGARPSTDIEKRNYRYRSSNLAERRKLIQELLMQAQRKPAMERCRPRVHKLEVTAVNPGTKERTRVNVAHLQDMEDRLSALRECVETMFGSCTYVYKKLDRNGNGMLSLAEMEDGLNSLHIPWQQVTGLTRMQLFKLLDEDQSGSIDILEFLGKEALTARPHWSQMSVVDQWDDYCNKVIDLDLSNLQYSPPLWLEDAHEVTSKMEIAERGTRRRLNSFLRNSPSSSTRDFEGAFKLGRYGRPSISREDMDYIQTKVVRIEKFLKDFNENKRDLMKLKLVLSSITDAKDKAAEIRKVREDQERERQRIKTAAGMALVDNGNGKITIFGKNNSLKLSQFSAPSEEDLPLLFSLNNPSLVSGNEIAFRQELKQLGLSLVEGDKVKEYFEKFACSGVDPGEDRKVGREGFCAILGELLKRHARASELVGESNSGTPATQSNSYWISASSGKDFISLGEFLHCVVEMPYGASPKEFTVTILAALLSAAAGSSIVHAIMKPNEAPVDFSDEVKARTRAIEQMQAELEKTR